MKEKGYKILSLTAISLLLMVTAALLLQRSADAKEQVSEGCPDIAVVNRQGVGQTEAEIKRGMNRQVVYDSGSKTLSWEIGNKYDLVEDYTYYITFRVEGGEVTKEECRFVKR